MIGGLDHLSRAVSLGNPCRLNMKPFDLTKRSALLRSLWGPSYWDDRRFPREQSEEKAANVTPLFW